MAIPSNVILMWGGTNASIPTGWSRVTSLDDRYPKAWGTQNPNVDAGSASHTHSSSAHSHAMDSHSHHGYTNRAGDPEDGGGSDPTRASRDNHDHEFTITGITSGALSDAVTYGTTGLNNFPYYTVIFVKPTSTVGVLRSGIMAYYSGATEPNNWYKCDGNNGTPDLTDKYLRGATTGGNAGTASTTDTHTHSLDHTHSATSHESTGLSGAGDRDGRYEATPSVGGQVVGAGHQHVITLNSYSESASAYTGSVTSESLDLEHKKLKVIQATTAYQPLGIIGMILSTASIPKGWVLCDGTNDTLDLRDKFIKITNTNAEIGTTGGSNTHTHSASNSHTHTTTGGSHTHSGGSGSYAGEEATTGSGGTNESKAHIHSSVNSLSSATSTWASTTITSNSQDHQPQYLTVAYIQLNKLETGGNFLLNLI